MEERKSAVKYLCPSCGALNEEDAPFCTGCGMPLKADSRSRKEQIERRLREAGQAETGRTVFRPIPSTEPAGFPLRAEGPQPVLPPDGRPEAQEAEAAREGEGRISRRPLWRWAILCAVVLAVLAAAAAAWALFYRDTGYTSSPERVLDGVEHAINTQDFQLFCDLIDLPEEERAALGTPSWMTAKSRTELRVVDVLEGEHHQFALVYFEGMVKQDDGGELVWDEDAVVRWSAQMVKTDGQWKLDGDSYWLFFSNWGVTRDPYIIDNGLEAYQALKGAGESA